MEDISGIYLDVKIYLLRIFYICFGYAQYMWIKNEKIDSCATKNMNTQYIFVIFVQIVIFNIQLNIEDLTLRNS